MANFGMDKGMMVSEDVTSKNRAGVVTGLAETDTIPNGAFVVADDSQAQPLPFNATYNIGNISAENFAKFTTGATGASYILDASEIPEVTDINGNTYKVGGILSNLSFAYNKQLRYRKLEIEDKLYIFDGNVVGTAPTLGQYLIPTNASFLFTATATKPATGFAFRVELIKPLTNGLTNKGNQYYGKVVQL